MTSRGRKTTASATEEKLVLTPDPIGFGGKKSRSASVQAEYFFTTESTEGTEIGKEGVRIPDPNPFFLLNLCALCVSVVKTSKPNSRVTFA